LRDAQSGQNYGMGHHQLSQVTYHYTNAPRTKNRPFPPYAFPMHQQPRKVILPESQAWEDRNTLDNLDEAITHTDRALVIL
jgi:hypothetical protein